MGPSSPSRKGAKPPNFRPCLLWPNGWMMKTPLGTEVDIRPGHIMLDGDPSPPAKGAQQPLFSAHVCCGHGCPSQLLPSSCFQLITNSHNNSKFLRYFVQGLFKLLMLNCFTYCSQQTISYTQSKASRISNKIT